MEIGELQSALLWLSLSTPRKLELAMHWRERLAGVEAVRLERTFEFPVAHPSPCFDIDAGVRPRMFAPHLSGSPGGTLSLP
jgi:hypothetical protein